MEFRTPPDIPTRRPTDRQSWRAGTDRETIKRAVPSINYQGASAYYKALDENLMAALSGKQSAEEAMQRTEKEWEKVTQRTGQQKIAQAIKASMPAWPTIED
jgi:multiple sugar transport system substrate-binding protein